MSTVRSTRQRTASDAARAKDGAIATVITSTLRLAFGIFIDPMRDLFGWTLGVSSTAYAIHFVISGIAAIGFGRLTDRIGTRPLLISGVLLFTAALLLATQVSSLWQLYLTYGVLLGLASGRDAGRGASQSN